VSTEVLSKIGEEILRDAEAEAKRKIGDAEKYAKELKEKAKIEAEAEVQKSKDEALENVRILEERKLSEARRHAALRILKEKNELISKAFKDAAVRLEGLVNEDVYFKTLSRLVGSSAKQLGSNDLKIKLTDKDLKRQKELIGHLKLASNLNVTIDKTSVKSIGGLIASTPDERIKIDNTFEAKLLAVEKTRKKEISNIMFGE
jgi:vacuolar-type H+-ATPase subunit E/Vma4